MSAPVSGGSAAPRGRTKSARASCIQQVCPAHGKHMQDEIGQSAKLQIAEMAATRVREQMINFLAAAYRSDRERGGATRAARGRLLMKAPVLSVPLCDWLPKKPVWFDHQTAVALTFAVKTFAASLLALYIAFWAGLDDPRWSFLTVFVVSQPDSGLVLAKSFYRILGTIAGMLVTIALVFGFAQYGELFVAGLAVWICFCNFAARAVRNFASYGFQLAGYTVAIVGIPAALNPSGAYDLLVARFTEILLGIICATLVSRLILLRELSPKLVELVRTLARRAETFATTLLAPDADRDHV